MNAHALRDEAIECLRSLEVVIRLEHLGGSGGGSCTIKSRRVLFVDLDADNQAQLDSCLATLKNLPEADTIFLSPALREQLERCP